jgi:hypothetical protein
LKLKLITVSVAAAALALAGTAGASVRHERVALNVRVAVSHHHAKAAVVRGYAAGHIVGGGLLSAASTYLGLDKATIVADLKAGQSLAQIAVGQKKTADGLVAALLAPVKLHLDAAVAASRLTAAQETAVLSRLQTLVTALVNRTLPVKPFTPAIHVNPNSIIGAGLTYLGVDLKTLFTQLRSGKTLADVANATPGKSAAGLVDAVVAATKDRLDAQVAAGRLTSAQETSLLATFRTSVTALVNGHA